jgi:hypothetical protein
MVKIHFKGNYSGDPASLPLPPEHPTAKMFKEAKNIKTLSLCANLLALVITVGTLVPLYFVYGKESFFSWRSMVGACLAIVLIIPHEYLHAICFKTDAYIFSSLRHGMFFAFSTDSLSKSRFIFMCLLPNIVFGIIPYIFGIVFPQMVILGVLGAVSIGAGAGDYINVFNALIQMPNKALVYMKGLNSWWYKPEEEKKALEEKKEQAN